MATLRVMKGYTVVASCTPPTSPVAATAPPQRSTRRMLAQRLAADAVDRAREPRCAEHAVGAVIDRVATDHVARAEPVEEGGLASTCPSSR